jgi:hypothetical protein
MYSLDRRLYEPQSGFERDKEGRKCPTPESTGPDKYTLVLEIEGSISPTPKPVKLPGP